MGVEVEIRIEAARHRPSKSEVLRLHSDSSALQRAASWKPGHTLEEGLRATIAWFSDPRNLAHYKTDQYSI